MLGSRPRGQFELLMAGSLRDLIPDEHVLARADRVLELSWLRAEVRGCYAAAGAGRPSIDPEAAVRLLPRALSAGFVEEVLRISNREAIPGIGGALASSHKLSRAAPFRQRPITSQCSKGTAAC
jgi:hypothetical protein